MRYRRNVVSWAMTNWKLNAYTTCVEKISSHIHDMFHEYLSKDSEISLACFFFIFIHRYIKDFVLCLLSNFLPSTALVVVLYFAYIHYSQQDILETSLITHKNNIYSNSGKKNPVTNVTYHTEHYVNEYSNMFRSIYWNYWIRFNLKRIQIFFALFTLFVILLEKKLHYGLWQKSENFQSFL